MQAHAQSMHSDFVPHPAAARNAGMTFRIPSRQGTARLTRVIRSWPSSCLRSQCKQDAVESRSCDYHVWVHSPPAAAGLNHRSIGSQLANLGIRVAIDVVEDDEYAERAEAMVTSACMCIFVIWEDFFYDRRSLRLLRHAVMLSRPVVVIIAPGATFRIKPPRKSPHDPRPRQNGQMWQKEENTVHQLAVSGGTLVSGVSKVIAQIHIFELIVACTMFRLWAVPSMSRASPVFFNRIHLPPHTASGEALSRSWQRPSNSTITHTPPGQPPIDHQHPPHSFQHLHDPHPMDEKLERQRFDVPENAWNQNWHPHLPEVAVVFEVLNHCHPPTVPLPNSQITCPHRMSPHPISSPSPIACHLIPNPLAIPSTYRRTPPFSGSLITISKLPWQYWSVAWLLF